MTDIFVEIWSTSLLHKNVPVANLCELIQAPHKLRDPAL